MTSNSFGIARPSATLGGAAPGTEELSTGTDGPGMVGQPGKSQAAATWTGPHCLAGTGRLENGLRRGLDIAFSAAGLLFFLPLFALVAAAVAATSLRIPTHSSR